MARNFRIKCPGCGNVRDITGDCTCKKCGAPLSPALPGMLHIYRMGNFIGSTNKLGIYINGQPYGYVGNRETVHLPLPYGTYNVHVALGVSRKCNDLGVTLSPQAPIGYLKASLRPGFWTNSFNIEPALPSEMPEL